MIRRALTLRIVIAVGLGLALIAGLGGLTGLTGRSGTFNGLGDVPLPGGPDLGSDPIQLTITTEDVLSLARQASVKVNDVTIGRVDSIERVGWNARVKLSVRSDVALPANAIAMIRQTGLLGEKYVELSPPYNVAARGALTDGATIPIDRSGRSFEVEEVLGSLSVLLNDGGLERLHTITTELHQALGGRDSDVKGVLRRLQTLTATLDENRTAIVDALDGLDAVSAEAASGAETIARAIDRIGPAIRVLADQRRELTSLLRATNRLGVSGTQTIRAVREDTVVNLRALSPVLTQLAAVGEDLPEAVTYLAGYPFPDSGLSAFKGDYVNFDAQIKIDLGALLAQQAPQDSETPGSGGNAVPGPGDLLPDLLGALPSLPGLPGLGTPPGTTRDEPLDGLGLTSLITSSRSKP